MVDQSIYLTMLIRIGVWNIIALEEGGSHVWFLIL